MYKSEVKTVVNQAGNADALLVKILKPGQPETVSVDWENPALNADLSDDEWEKRAAEQLEKNLGIESYSSTYSFIYITRKEVRHEILIPLATLATIITDFEQQDEDFLDIPEQDLAKAKIEDLFGNINPVTINSVSVKPVFDRIDFYGLDIRDFAMQAERRKISMANGRVGIIMSYSAKSVPKEVSVEWELFNNVVQKVEATAFIFDDAEMFTFSRFDRKTDDDGNVDNSKNVYRPTQLNPKESAAITQVSSEFDFENLQPPIAEKPTLDIPLGYFLAAASLLLCIVFLLYRNQKFSFVFGAVAPILLITTLTGGFPTPIRFPHPTEPATFEMPQEQGQTVFAKLHQNIFRAFDYPEQSDIYDALANSVDGPLLRELFLKINDSLKIKEQGGAVSRIDEVKILENKIRPYDSDNNTIPGAAQVYTVDSPGFPLRCRWQLVGSVEHWGHIHERTNEYDAVFEVTLVDDNWKITSMNMVGEPKQGIVRPKLRKLTQPTSN